MLTLNQSMNQRNERMNQWIRGTTNLIKLLINE